MIDTAALNDLLEVYFRAGTQKPAFFMGLVDLTNFSAFAASDTMLSHPGWQELTTYSEPTRVQWSPPAASGGQLASSSDMRFTMTSPSSVYGVFLCSDSTKGGTAGLLVGPVALDSIQVLPTGEILKVRANMIALG